MQRTARMRGFALLTALALAGTAGATASTTPAAAPTVVSVAGAAPADIQAGVDSYRALLGANNASGPPTTSGRREVNWDGAPDTRAAPNDLPGDFFNATVPRGVVSTTPGSGFQVSADTSNPTNTPVEFASLDPSYAANFQTFSPQRLFSAIGSNVQDVHFFVPGTKAPAAVRGFGSIFTDVETDGSTTIEYYSAAGSLGVYKVAASANGGLSFLGVDFGENVVTRVRIVSGSVAPGAGVLDISDGGAYDIAVMDDFIYGEPIARGLAYVPLVQRDASLYPSHGQE